MKAWTGGNSPKEHFFRLEDSRIWPRFAVDPALVQTFSALVQEVIDYRLATYEARRSATDQSTVAPCPNDCHKVWNCPISLP